MVSQVDLKSGRIKQKLRTRQDLLKAAWEMLAKGHQPTVEEVADRAGISRATAYRYFPNRERMLIEAVLNREPVSADDLLTGTDSNSPIDRATRVLAHNHSQIVKNETLYRSLLRSSQEEWMANKDRFVLRSDQRLEHLNAALQSVRGKMPDKELEDLTYALAAMVSIESYIALRDACQLTRKRSLEIMGWAVRELIGAVLSRNRL